jgi:hypothetical protein
MKVSVIGQNGIAGSRHLATAQEYGCEIVEPDNADVVVIAIPDNLHARYCAFGICLLDSLYSARSLSAPKKQIWSRLWSCLARRH